jgi:hypothetical protein
MAKSTKYRVGKTKDNFGTHNFQVMVMNGGGKPVAKTLNVEKAELVAKALNTQAYLDDNPELLALEPYITLIAHGIRVIPNLDGNLPVFLVRGKGESAGQYLPIFGGAFLNDKPSYNPASVSLFQKQYGKDLTEVARNVVVSLLRPEPELVGAKKPEKTLTEKVAKAIKTGISKAKKAAPKVPGKKPKPATVKAVKAAQSKVYGEDWPDPQA